jgi:nitrate/nitrite transporter NarK
VVLWVLPSGLLTGAAAAGGLALMATIGNLGGYVAPYMIGLVKEATGRTDMGLFAMAAAMFLGTLLVQLLPRNSTIDEAGQMPDLKDSPAVGAA